MYVCIYICIYVDLCCVTLRNAIRNLTLYRQTLSATGTLRKPHLLNARARGLHCVYVSLVYTYISSHLAPFSALLTKWMIYISLCSGWMQRQRVLPHNTADNYNSCKKWANYLITILRDYRKFLAYERM